MFNFNTFKQKSPQQRFLFFLGMIMLLLYIVLGSMFIFNFGLANYFEITDTYKIIFGSLLIVYAVFRFGRLLKQNND